MKGSFFRVTGDVISSGLGVSAIKGLTGDSIFG